MPAIADLRARRSAGRNVTDSRLTPARLLQTLEERTATGQQARTALLVVRLDPARRGPVLRQGSRHAWLLDEIERRLRPMLRAGDRYAFASREELWLMLPDLPGKSIARLVANALLECLRRPFESPTHTRLAEPIRMRPAIGGTWIPADRRIGAARLIGLAIAASDRAAGTDEPITIHEVAGDLPCATDDLDALERPIRRALESNALEMHFQPKVDLRTGQCQAAEALMRWPEGLEGMTIDSGTIVAICERRGLIEPLTRLTLNTTLRQMAVWRAAQLDASIAFNLSAAMLSEPTLAMAIQQSLDTWSIPAARLTLEITESALVQDETTACKTMERLHELGCQLSIDDFGTGYSPFTYLRRFPVQELKIDRSFIEPVLRKPRDQAIVGTLIELAHAFGMKVVAEGIEDARTEAFLAARGCDLGQGWHYAAALHADAFPDWCAQRNGDARDDIDDAADPSALRI